MKKEATKLENESKRKIPKSKAKSEASQFKDKGESDPRTTHTQKPSRGSEICKSFYTGARMRHNTAKHTVHVRERENERT